MKNYKELLKNISTFIFDYDGVLSDGHVLILSNGEHVRSGYVKDGFAIHLALKKNYRVVVISGGTADSMEARCRILGITDVFLSVPDKLQVFKKFTSKNKINAASVVYVGDDLPDLPAMKAAGVAVCPSDAAEEIKAISHYISPYHGGKGCVRDIIEQVLKVQGKWMDNDAFIW